MSESKPIKPAIVTNPPPLQRKNEPQIRRAVEAFAAGNAGAQLHPATGRRDNTVFRKQIPFHASSGAEMTKSPRRRLISGASRGKI